MRLANERRQGNPGLGPKEDRSRRQDFIEPGVLAECVKKIGTFFISRKWGNNMLTSMSSGGLSIAHTRTGYDSTHRTRGTTSITISHQRFRRRSRSSNYRFASQTAAVRRQTDQTRSFDVPRGRRGRDGRRG